MRFPLTQQLLDEARAFSLRAACRDCFFWSARQGECWHGWPDEGQRSWPDEGQRSWPLARAQAPGASRGGEGGGAGAEQGAADAAGQQGGDEVGVGQDVAFCKEFELR